MTKKEREQRARDEAFRKMLEAQGAVPVGPAAAVAGSGDGAAAPLPPRPLTMKDIKRQVRLTGSGPGFRAPLTRVIIFPL